MAKLTRSFDTVTTRPHKSVELQISQEYIASDGVIVVEHSALREIPANWILMVKCRDVSQSIKQSSPRWINLHKRFPNAKVVETKTDLIVDVNQFPCPTNLVLAAFGTPGESSKKRMQLITFAKHWPQEGRVEVSVLLIDDTQNAFEGICARQEAQGKNMLAAMAVLFVSAKEPADIKITVEDIQPGWKVDGKKNAVFAFDQALRSAELDISCIPSHRFVLRNTDTSLPCLSCKIVAAHTKDEAVVEVLKSFKTRQKLVTHVTVDNFPGKRIVPVGKQNICALECSSAGVTAIVFVVLLSLFLIPVKMTVQTHDRCSQLMAEMDRRPASQQCDIE